jgi:hypothetical protein
MDYDRMLRFIHYLRFEFYSFGHQMQRRFRYTDGSPITSTSDITYYEIRGFTAEPLHIGSSADPVPISSPLFDRYRNAATGDMETAAAATPACSTPSKRKTKLSKLRKPRILTRDAYLDLLRPLRRLLSRA